MSQLGTGVNDLFVDGLPLTCHRHENSNLKHPRALRDNSLIDTNLLLQ